jgi:DNA invertase Pin-like site-specific DNA recombinase
MIQERVRAGLARAKDAGKRLGRPPLAADIESAIRKALVTPGRPSVRKIAEQFAVNASTVQRISAGVQLGPFGNVSAVAVPQ